MGNDYDSKACCALLRRWEDESATALGGGHALGMVVHDIANDLVALATHPDSPVVLLELACALCNARMLQSKTLYYVSCEKTHIIGSTITNGDALRKTLAGHCDL